MLTEHQIECRKELCALCPKLAIRIMPALALLDSGETLDRIEGLARLAQLAKEALSETPFASAALLRICRDAASELAGKAFEHGASRDAAELARMLDHTPKKSRAERRRSP